MTDIPTLLEENAASLLELRTLVQRLREPDLDRSLGGGWTVGKALGHLAFWDMRVALMAGRWRTDAAVSGVDIEGDVVNEAVEALLLVAPGRALATLALAAASAANTAVNRLQPHLQAQAFVEGSVFGAARAPHRREHLEQIERVLGG